MKITIERAPFLKVLGHIQNVVERRNNTIPILSNVKIGVADGQVALNATDMDLDIVESVTAEIERPGSTTVPAHVLYDIVRELPEGAQVEIEINNNDTSRMTLRAGRSCFTLSCLPATDFPLMAAGNLPHAFSLAANELRTLIDRTRFAISTEETRYYLNGIYLHAAENNKAPVLRAVATDGHRLASVETSLPSGAENMPGIIIPRKAVTELHRLIDVLDDEVQILLSETKIQFCFGDTVLTSKLIDGTFPDYTRVIPVNNDKVMNINRKFLSEAISRVSAISTERSRAVKLAIVPNSLILSANSPESGTAIEELEVDYQGEALEIGFNSRYLLDIMHQIKSDTAQILFAQSADPTILSDDADTSAIYVLMPMRV